MFMMNNQPGNLYQESVDRLLQIPKFGAGIGLHRMIWILDQLVENFPKVTFDAIKVTGSNGKGSTCLLLSAIMAEIGVRHGLYTSPHLLRFNERIKVNGQDIGNEDLLDAILWGEEILKEYGRHFPNDVIAAFEVFTGIALYHFAQQNLKTVILEAGIGGRYDSTRVVPGNLVALTSLDLEHTQLLGKTIEEIAYNKIDLCTEGGTLVLGQVDSDILRRIKAICRLKTYDYLRLPNNVRLKTYVIIKNK
jgi:dihydrofolate synthase/folylpolyglutamate synthase